MTTIRVKPRQGAPFWILRATVQGQTRFWNGLDFVLTSLIQREETIRGVEKLSRGSVNSAV